MEKRKKKHIGRNIALGLLVLLFILIAIFLIIDYSHYAKDKDPNRTFIIPRLEISVFQITTLTADKADLIGDMVIHNPLPFNLRSDSLQYKIFIGGVEVIKSTYPKSVLIKRWDTTELSLPVTAYNDKLVSVLKQAEAEGKDSIIYEVQTSFGTNIIAHKDFNLDIKKLLPVFYIPEVSLPEIAYDSLSIKGVTLYLHSVVVNKNKFAFKFKNLKFRFAMANEDWVEGSLPGVIDIPDTSTTALVLPLHISFKDIGKSIGPLIRSGKNTPYKFELTLQLVSDSRALKDSKVILKNAAAIKEIVKLAKDEKKKSREKEVKAPSKEKKKKIKIIKAKKS